MTCRKLLRCIALVWYVKVREVMRELYLLSPPPSHANVHLLEKRCKNNNNNYKVPPLFPLIFPNKVIFITETLGY